MSTWVVISNLPPYFDDVEVDALFSRVGLCGEIRHIVVDVGDYAVHATAYVQLCHSKDAKKAAANLDGIITCESRAISVAVVWSERDTLSTVAVARIPDSVAETQLKDMFEPFGDVIDVYIYTHDRDRRGSGGLKKTKGKSKKSSSSSGGGGIESEGKKAYVTFKRIEYAIDAANKMNGEVVSYEFGDSGLAVALLNADARNLKWKRMTFDFVKRLIPLSIASGAPGVGGGGHLRGRSSRGRGDRPPPGGGGMATIVKGPRGGGGSEFFYQRPARAPRHHHADVEMADGRAHYRPPHAPHPYVGGGHGGRDRGHGYVHGGHNSGTVRIEPHSHRPSHEVHKHMDDARMRSQSHDEFYRRERERERVELGRGGGGGALTPGRRGAGARRPAADGCSPRRMLSDEYESDTSGRGGGKPSKPPIATKRRLQRHHSDSHMRIPPLQPRPQPPRASSSGRRTPEKGHMPAAGLRGPGTGPRPHSHPHRHHHTEGFFHTQAREHSHARSHSHPEARVCAVKDEKYHLYVGDDRHKLEQERDDLLAKEAMERAKFVRMHQQRAAAAQAQAHGAHVHASHRGHFDERVAVGLGVSSGVPVSTSGTVTLVSGTSGVAAVTGAVTGTGAATDAQMAEYRRFQELEQLQREVYEAQMRLSMYTATAPSSVSGASPVCSGPMAMTGAAVTGGAVRTLKLDASMTSPALGGSIAPIATGLGTTNELQPGVAGFLVQTPVSVTSSMGSTPVGAVLATGALPSMPLVSTPPLLATTGGLMMPTTSSPLLGVSMGMGLLPPAGMAAGYALQGSMPAMPVPMDGLTGAHFVPCASYSTTGSSSAESLSSCSSALSHSQSLPSTGPPMFPPMSPGLAAATDAIFASQGLTHAMLLSAGGFGTGGNGFLMPPTAAAMAAAVKSASGCSFRLQQSQSSPLGPRMMTAAAKKTTMTDASATKTPSVLSGTPSSGSGSTTGKEAEGGGGSVESSGRTSSSVMTSAGSSVSEAMSSVSRPRRKLKPSLAQKSIDEAKIKAKALRTGERGARKKGSAKKAATGELKLQKDASTTKSDSTLFTPTPTESETTTTTQKAFEKREKEFICKLLRGRYSEATAKRIAAMFMCVPLAKRQVMVSNDDEFFTRATVFNNLLQRKAK